MMDQTKLVKGLGGALFVVLIVAFWPAPTAAQPLFETEHDWRITIGENAYGLRQVVQQPGELRQTTIELGPWRFHTRLRAAEVAAIALGPLVLVVAVTMSRWRRKAQARGAA
jgi:hypothetical protein